MKISSPCPRTICCGQQMLSLDAPIVMGILNVTADSFYDASRCLSQDDILARAYQIAAEGGTIIDIGAYSTRPNAIDVPQNIEIQRVCTALDIVRRALPQIVVSVDTFRSEVVCAAVENYGEIIVNDVSGGEADPKMFETIAKFSIPYILMHSRGNPQTMQHLTDYDDIMGEITYWFSEQINRLHLLGVCDIIIDPGFGFAKTAAQNFKMLAHLSEFNIFNKPIIAGISRKSMIYKTLNVLPSAALNGSAALNAIALQNGASILRVHDVKSAVEVIKLMEQLKINS